jgi:hypothetical protein
MERVEFLFFSLSRRFQTDLHFLEQNTWVAFLG